MPRFYLRRLRAGLGAQGGNGATPAGTGAAVLDHEPASYRPVQRADSPVVVAPARAPRPRSLTGSAADEIAVEAVMTEAVAELTGVTPERDAFADGVAEGAELVDGADGDTVAEGEMPAGGPRRRRRRGRRGHGRPEGETAAVEAAGLLPGEPALPPEPVEFDQDYVPDVPPSSHLAALVQSGGLVLPDPRRRRRRGRGGALDRVPEREERPAGAIDEPAALPEPLVRRVEPPSRGGRDRLSPMEEMIARQNVIFDQLVQKQTAMLKAMERMMTAMERRGGGGNGTGVIAALPRVGVFVDVPNIVYAADRIGVQIDWGKVLHYLTRDRQLVRATAYSPVSDDSHQRTEMQRFVQPFYNLPYRILTKPMKRFGNGEIKANFDVELAIDVVTMADRLDIVSLISGDGDFRRMVELVQSKGVRVEVIAFSSSTAGELRAVCDDYIDFSQHLHEFCLTK